LIEQMFDHGWVSALPVEASPLAVVEQLRERIRTLEGGPARTPVPMHQVLEDVVSMRVGASYTVDSASLALAMAAGASAAGEWVGFAGWSDFGAEAATQWGIDLSRTVLVPEPGEHWLEVVAALVDVLRVVVLCPPGRVDPKSMSVVEARLRARSAALVVWGEWSSSEARLTTEHTVWTGAGRGEGRLRERQVRVAVRRGARPPARADLVFPTG
jgi:hypothetical protein